MSNAPKKENATGYAVGRGKPPRHTRFAPGQSGNPGGRKKGSVNLKTMLEEVLTSEIELKENGKKRTVSLLEALLKRAVQQALSGDMRALKDLLDRYERCVGAEPERNADLADEDRAILQRVLTMRTQRAAPGPGPQPDGDFEQAGIFEEDDHG